MVTRGPILSAVAVMSGGWITAVGAFRGQPCRPAARALTSWNAATRWTQRPARNHAQRGMATSQAKAKMMMWEQATAKERTLTLNDLVKFGRNADRHTVLLSACWMQKELPVRLAKRIWELKSLPKPMWSTKAVSSLIQLYEESFVRIIDHEPPQTTPAMKSFSTMLADIKQKHRIVQANIGAGFAEMQQKGVKQCSMETTEIQDVLTRFYQGRIGIRVLIDQHLSLCRDAQEHDCSLPEYSGRPSSSDYVGCVKTRCSIKRVLDAAIADARAACLLHLRTAPRVDICGAENLMTAYIPGHLYVVLFEVLKNAMRATVEVQQQRGGELPAIEATVSGGDCCSVRISDHGGGIPPTALPRIWNFAYSSAPEGMRELAGYGYGLPLSRLYARYWGGDLTVSNRPHRGVDCLVRLGPPQPPSTSRSEVSVWVGRGQEGGVAQRIPATAA